MLDVLVEKRGRHVSKEDLGSAIGMEASGGTFSAYLSDLRQAGLILVDRDGVRANKETLFLWRRRSMPLGMRGVGHHLELTRASTRRLNESLAEEKRRIPS